MEGYRAVVVVSRETWTRGTSASNELMARSRGFYTLRPAVEFPMQRAVPALPWRYRAIYTPVMYPAI